MTKVVFMGSPDFALPSLRALAQQYDVVGVVTQPDRASGRGRELKAPPVKVLAQELGIPVVQPEKLKQPEAMEQLRAWEPDLIVVAAFGQILRKDVLDLPRFGCINVHASLLPRWRGAAPINAAILAGDEETGVTIMQMDVGLDTGPILAKRAIRLKPDDTAASVTEALSNLGADLLIETLPDYLSGKLIPQPQPEDGTTYAPMLKKEEGKLDFTRDVGELERRIRAFNPWPGAFMDFDDTMLKVHRAHVTPLPAGEGLGVRAIEAGQRLIVENQPAVAARGGVLVLDEVQPAGKKPMSGKSFLAGARNWLE
ncbi:MAG: methionyl-tRNA formyltransferase [Chloroflexi bacterium]|nr:methionyl-tRNA formyltransferase [Chloroflexota bacterium]